MTELTVRQHHAWRTFMRSQQAMDRAPDHSYVTELMTAWSAHARFASDEYFADLHLEELALLRDAMSDLDALTAADLPARARARLLRARQLCAQSITAIEAFAADELTVPVPEAIGAVSVISLMTMIAAAIDSIRATALVALAEARVVILAVSALDPIAPAVTSIRPQQLPAPLQIAARTLSAPCAPPQPLSAAA